MPNIVNVANPLVNNNIDNANKQNINNLNIANNNLRYALTPDKFSGYLQDNGMLWLQKFEAYCAQQNIADDAR